MLKWNSNTLLYGALLLAITLGCSKGDDDESSQPSEGQNAELDGNSPAQGEDSAAGTQVADPDLADARRQPRQVTVSPVREGLLAPEETATPEAAVTTFLNAVQMANVERSDGMLTETARIETAKHAYSISPPGTATADYTITQVTLVSERGDGVMNGAHVMCEWSDFNEGGVREKYNITWILRRENHGWRIAGMATELFADLPLVVFNFEDPADMEAQRQWATAEAQRRAQLQSSEGTVQQASQPSNDPAGTIQR